MPQWLLDRVSVPAATLQQHAPSGVAGGEKIGEGQRNHYLSREAFRLRKQGASVEQIVDVLRAVNAARCDPPLDDAEVRQIAYGKAPIVPEPGPMDVGFGRSPLPDGVTPAAMPCATQELGTLPATVAKEISEASADTLFLPNDYLPAPVAAARIFDHLGGTRELFRRGDAVVELDRIARISVVTSTALRSRLNNRGRKVRAFKVDPHGKVFHSSKQCSDDAAKLLLSTLEVGRLPEIQLVTRMPILAERGGELCTTEPGYNADCGVLVTEATTLPVVSVNDAGAALRGLLRDFRFAEQGDEARTLASVIAPALRMSRLVRGDALVTSVEADQSQTGKGFLLKVLRAIYGETAYLIAQRSGGVGSVDESLGQALLSGAPFVSLDNLRGRMDSQYLESIITSGGDLVSVRVPHRGEVRVAIDRTLFQLTSNGVEGTVDLSNRLLLIRLRKQPPGYQFTSYVEGDVLQHIEAWRAYYLGCVHAIVRHWHGAGKPQLPTDHSFRQWVGALDWIVRSVWNAGALLDGHASAVSRIADAGLSWLRQLAFVVLQQGKAAQELSASDLFQLGRDHDVLPPQTRPDCADEAGALAAGRVLSRCFKERAAIELDGVRVTRTEREERNQFRMVREKGFYVFTPRPAT